MKHTRSHSRILQSSRLLIFRITLLHRTYENIHSCQLQETYIKRSFHCHIFHSISSTYKYYERGPFRCHFILQTISPLHSHFIRFHFQNQFQLFSSVLCFHTSLSKMCTYFALMSMFIVPASKHNRMYFNTSRSSFEKEKRSTITSR